ncbi:hypothetical protein [Aestuariimicrobium sp. Y1814]|uniref:hypothetical protein n=1 Tax=Aestuariimicrobium sp. Y1814 TaxID=3418742 RepID=UPI003DA75101
MSVYRTPGGAGIRLDGGTVFAGAEIGAHFDSMMVKLTCRGRDFATAVRRAQRALAEFRIRGVSTNIGFLRGVLADPDFLAGRATTAGAQRPVDHVEGLVRRDRRGRDPLLLRSAAGGVPQVQQSRRAGYLVSDVSKLAFRRRGTGPAGVCEFQARTPPGTSSTRSGDDS